MDKFSGLKAATCIAAKNFERWSKLAAMTSESSSVLHSTTLLETAQLLSALLAELEASKKSNAFLKEQLSQLANFNPDWDMLEACQESWREVSAALKEAETRLATPVRFPDCDIDSVSIMAHWYTDNHVAWVAGVAHAKNQIRAAGFKVEGDA